VKALGLLFSATLTVCTVVGLLRECGAQEQPPTVVMAPAPEVHITVVNTVATPAIPAVAPAPSPTPRATSIPRPRIKSATPDLDAILVDLNQEVGELKNLIPEGED
jgi:hypothetical protein